MRALLGTIAVAAVLAPSAASSGGNASYYGPGLYGERIACGGTLGSSTWGVAHRWLRCGTRVRICYRSRCTTAPVIDRGPYVGGRVLDLTAPVARWLCRCYSWGVRYVWYSA